MRKLVITILAVVMAAALLATACTQPGQAPATPAPPAATAPNTLDIGISTPLTGPMAFVGTQIQNAALLAIDDQNAQGGVTIAGQKYVLGSLVRDSKQDVVLSKSIAEELIFGKGVKIIVGPFVADAIGTQSVTERNKVIAVLAAPIIAGMCSPEKPYSFFWNSTFEQFYVNQAAYFQKFYPQAKTVVSMSPDIISLPAFVDAMGVVFPQYGLKWLGVEKFPLDAKDLTSVISRVLAKNPDIVDICCTGGMAGLGSLSIKQLRQEGFTGPIMVPLPPSRPELEEVIPKQHLTKIVVNYFEKDSPIVSDAFRAVYDQAVKKYQQQPENVMFIAYNPIRAVLKFLDGQPSLDNTALMEGLAKYHWQGIYGFENYWIGKKVWGIDRRVFIYPWTSEYIDGKLVTQFSAPIPHDLFE